MIPVLTPPAQGKYGDEQVAVVSRQFYDNFIHDQSLETLQGFLPTDEEGEWHIEALIDHSKFILRDKAEYDSDLKQLVVYCIVGCGDKILHYSRTKTPNTEDRLHSQRSIGVGGHMNPVDFKDVTGGIEAYNACLYRELKEEIGITDKDIVDDLLIGFVNDDESPVGCVHVGFVHYIEVKTEKLDQIEQALNDVTWDTIEDLQESGAAFVFDKMEKWSQMILPKLRETLNATHA
jgi:predicted NUDIX family phosphoesterase